VAGERRLIETRAKISDEFEPPKYLASLIAAVNDGAKAAQAGALLFALVGVYLLRPPSRRATRICCAGGG